MGCESMGAVALPNEYTHGNVRRRVGGGGPYTRVNGYRIRRMGMGIEAFCRASDIAETVRKGKDLICPEDEAGEEERRGQRDMPAITGVGRTEFKAAVVSSAAKTARRRAAHKWCHWLLRSFTWGRPPDPLVSGL